MIGTWYLGGDSSLAVGFFSGPFRVIGDWCLVLGGFRGSSLAVCSCSGAF